MRIMLTPLSSDTRQQPNSKFLVMNDSESTVPLNYGRRRAKPGTSPALMRRGHSKSAFTGWWRRGVAGKCRRLRSFDPETLVILETAFDEAWITLKTNGSGNIRPDELARRICHLAMEGERDPVRLHDRALGELIPATIWRELS